MGQTDSATTIEAFPRPSSARWPDPGQGNLDGLALTPAGRASLEQELRRLRDEHLPALVAQLSEARDDPATRTEGADLLTIQHEQQRVQRRVQDLTWMLRTARALAPRRDGVIALGSIVEIEDEGERTTVQVVDPREANPAEGRLSSAAPVGRALLGHRAGDTVVVDVPAGQRDVRIVAVPSEEGDSR